MTSTSSIEQSRDSFAAVRAEVAKAVVGQDAVVSGLSSRCSPTGTCCSKAFRASPRRCSCASLAAALSTRHEASAVHARPDARRRHGLARLRRAHGRVRVPRGPGLHEPAARRRDQPHAAQDAGRAARGDGGAAGHGRRRRRDRCPTRSW